jgi:hypothetical protein
VQAAPIRLICDGPEARLFAGGETGEVVGYASVFDLRDSQKSAVLPGAFRKSLAAWRDKGRSPPMLWQHDPEQPIGLWTALAEDRRGLKVTGTINLEVEQGRETWSLVKQRAVTGLSIGFTVVAEDFDKANDLRLLREVDLWEISLVTFPANPETHIEPVRFADKSAYERFLRQHGVAKAAARKLAAGGWSALVQPEPQPHNPALAKLLRAIDAAAAETRTGRYRKGNFHD